MFYLYWKRSLMSTHIPDTPPPLSVSRYDRFFTPEERRDLQENVIGDLADEIILERDLLYRLWEHSQNDRTTKERIRTVDMISRMASHLARLLRTRQALLAKKAEPAPLRELSEALGIRSSENENDIFLLKNPVCLTPQQWRLVQPLLPPQPPPTSRGRPSADYRSVIEAILWKLTNDRPWVDLPTSYPSYSTCYRYYRQWKRDGLLARLLTSLAQCQEQTPQSSTAQTTEV
jgi:transposase